MENYSVQVPPYTVGPEAYKKIEKQCHIYGSKAVVIGGKKAMAAAKEKLLCAVEDTGIEIVDFVWFGGECTFENAEALEQLEAVQQADVIFAVGGGKAIDTCKLVSIALEKPYFLSRRSHQTVPRHLRCLLYITKTEHFASLYIFSSRRSIFLLIQKLLRMRQKNIYGLELEILMQSIMK